MTQPMLASATRTDGQDKAFAAPEPVAPRRAAGRAADAADGRHRGRRTARRRRDPSVPILVVVAAVAAALSLWAGTTFGDLAAEPSPVPVVIRTQS